MSTQVQVEMMKSRCITFSGKFEPVLTTCRAPLANGKLCPRQDRHKVQCLEYEYVSTKLLSEQYAFVLFSAIFINNCFNVLVSSSW